MFPRPFFNIILGLRLKACKAFEHKKQKHILDRSNSKNVYPVFLSRHNFCKVNASPMSVLSSFSIRILASEGLILNDWNWTLPLPRRSWKTMIEENDDWDEEAEWDDEEELEEETE